MPERVRVLFLMNLNVLIVRVWFVGNGIHKPVSLTKLKDVTISKLGKKPFKQNC